MSGGKPDCCTTAEILQELWDQLLQKTLQHLQKTFEEDGAICLEPPSAEQHQTLKNEIENLFSVLQKEVPTFSPRYLGHMMSDISIPAIIGNIAVLFCNPNLAAKEVATAGVFLKTRPSISWP